MATTASSPAPPFPFPREYHFPAFFTRQTNLTTHHAQLIKWSALVLAYARHHRLFRLHLSAAADSDLFRNRRIDRRLGPADIRELLDFMRKDGRAEYVAKDSPGDVVFIYWRKPEEWAAVVEGYVEETGQKGSVLTVYELTEGEGTRGTGESAPVPRLELGCADEDNSTTRHGQRGAPQSAEYPRQARQGTNIRPGRLSRCQVLLIIDVHSNTPTARISNMAALRHVSYHRGEMQTPGILSRGRLKNSVITCVKARTSPLTCSPSC